MQAKLILVLALLCFSRCIWSQNCQASLSFIERAESWFEHGLQKRIYDVHITNTHATCAFNNSLTVQFNLPPGTRMGYSWGLYGQKLTGFDTLLPKQTHAGSGFVLEGDGSPSAAILMYDSCGCQADAILNPQYPPTGEYPPDDPHPSHPPDVPMDTTHYYYVAMKFLILTCDSDARLTVAKNVLDAVGSQYDVIDHQIWGDAPLALRNPDESGKYYAIISTIELNCWNTNQKTQIEYYERQYHVKTVILYSFPHPENGVTSSSGVSLSTDTSYLSFLPVMANYTGSTRPDAHIPIKGAYAYLAEVSDPVTATPVVRLSYNGTDYVAGAVIRYYDNRMRMEFYVDQAAWALYPVLLGNVWFEWASNGIFAGARRIEFNAHTDDIFMGTGTFDLKLREENLNNTYRIVPEDLTELVSWQAGINSRLPRGSNFTLTFPFNGATIVEKGGYDKDALFLKAKELRDYFIWESHTWAHLYLDNLTYDKVRTEYLLNDFTLLALFDTNDTQRVPNYCTRGTVTPSITGLFNPAAMRAIFEHGFRFVVGDNSRAELAPPNAYHSLHTSTAKNGIEGMYIIPRHATNIYYDGSLPQHTTTEFNYHYAAALGRSYNFSEIVARDVDVATAALLAFRHDPFMFHQANLRFSRSGFPDKKPHSLVSYWVDQVIDSVTKYSTLPIKSHKHDDLGQMYLDREDRDSCGFSGILKFSSATQEAVGMIARSDRKCVFGVSGVQSSGENVAFFETHGDQKTTWLKMTTGSNFEVIFGAPITPL
eukprot:Phypoly_transcript_03415.p1 GENE.Phypoly_transcript_03415~~Phypoly_transcript_03415.p1  ORF type:complete len:767 (+),score=124.06 Phypoly_transcript_03415:97-2397(+)